MHNFSDEQVEAAAQVIYGDDPAWGYVNDYGGGEVAARWEHLGAQVQEMFGFKARAALAAAGVIPLAMSAERTKNGGDSLRDTPQEPDLTIRYCPEHGDLLTPDIDGVDVRSTRCRESHSVASLRADLAPELRPSGVDEDALAEVRRQAAEEALLALANELSNREMPESGSHINMTSYREGLIDGVNRAVRTTERRAAEYKKAEE